MRCQVFISRAGRDGEGGALVEVDCQQHLTRGGLQQRTGVDLDRFGSVVVERDLVSIFLIGRGQRGLSADEGVEIGVRKGNWLQIEMPDTAGATEVDLVRRGIKYQFIASP